MINLLGRPGLWPGVFGAHELFHLFVMAGSSAHFRFMLTVVVPFGRDDGQQGARDPGSTDTSRAGRRHRAGRDGRPYARCGST